MKCHPNVALLVFAILPSMLLAKETASSQNIPRNTAKTPEAAEQAALTRQATVSEASARKTAQSKVPDGIVQAVEIEKEHGLLVWSYDFSRPNTKDTSEVLVNALTGKIVSVQIESAAEHAREASADAALAAKKSKQPK